MKSGQKNLTLGDLVAAAYDCAEMVSADKDIVASLSSRTVARWLVQTDRLDIAHALAPQAKPAKQARRVPRAAKAA